MRALVVGAAAGGGLPQWNCAAPNSAGFWLGAPPHPAATQSSLAVSADGERWLLINASPDLRSQIIALPQLQPRVGTALRNSPIAAVLLTNGDLDHIAGLLTLREGQPFTLYATDAILGVLAANPVFDALAATVVPRTPIHLDTTFEALPGLSVTVYPVPGKVPLFMESGEVATDLVGEQTVGVAISDGRATLHYIPGCAAVDAGLRARVDGADALLFDGTLYVDDEMVRAGVGTKTGRRMGHMSVSGPEGSVAAWAPARIGRRVFVHLNNTNPLWRDGPERAETEAAGWQIGHDGMELTL
ncbi:pyrroloquinoline quinone biosynthesis protein PqqB [Acuticoccus sp. I52.16.1]|uniref:pyrroloquinoline quinone biosynthesis protein PqqB n=1 Tax=Acuticoccus sp. I52.16.1 TaxID=2928472 RepID=UPI001FD60846|nr:pyrroloquinoline quinone biosynthesis protein PqqB [Acuticoccus sp. I52.16.1]UOM34452.1 pyrroloquinoline quinone biosynthesis protein PqqB [Acuticoccus sp. I52.16.1]